MTRSKVAERQRQRQRQQLISHGWGGEDDGTVWLVYKVELGGRCIYIYIMTALKLNVGSRNGDSGISNKQGGLPQSASE